MLTQRKIRICRKFTFDMAHALYGYQGQCKNIHGHTYHLEVMLEGTPLHDPSNPIDGMVMDFGDLKSIVTKHILEIFDHALVLNGDAAYTDHNAFLENFEKIVILPFQPTCENLILHFVDLLIDKFTKDVQLYSIRLDETPNAYAIWENTNLWSQIS